MNWDVGRNPGLLKLELYCRGMRIDPSCDLADDGRQILRTRAGLGSGLELLLPEGLWTNVPVVEGFAAQSPFSLLFSSGQYWVHKDGKPVTPVRLSPCPSWYSKSTGSGKAMTSIGTLQGTYLGIYLGRACDFWREKPKKVNCKFCSTGMNIGNDDDPEKRVEEVLEVVRAARAESGVTYIDFNTGFLVGDNYLEVLEPYVKAVKQETGLLVGVQCPPEADFERYHRLRALGVNRVSFCFEIFDPERFAEVCPGKALHHGLKRYLEAIEYCVPIFDTTNGEIIAGLEPPQSSIAAIDWLTERGAIPTVCVFRPLVSTDYKHLPPPDPEAMVPVFRRLYEACMERGLPIGIAPNVNVSLVLLPDEGRYFTEDPGRFWWNETKLAMMKAAFRTRFYVGQWLRA
ncbi:MAG: hypothetical protein HYY25_06810 [Candidatus Wallbacteria bacterium]|nr:hypothetical protein [Candidatus Wallbacteria bacterium]